MCVAVRQWLQPNTRWAGWARGLCADTGGTAAAPGVEAVLQVEGIDKYRALIEAGTTYTAQTETPPIVGVACR